MLTIRVIIDLDLALDVLNRWSNIIETRILNEFLSFFCVKPERINACAYDLYYIKYKKIYSIQLCTVKHWNILMSNINVT